MKIRDQINAYMASHDPPIVGIKEDITRIAETVIAAKDVEIERLRAENEDLRKTVVRGFYEEEMPMFQQGMNPPHELLDPVTAKECEGYIEKIKELRFLVLKRIES